MQDLPLTKFVKSNYLPQATFGSFSNDDGNGKENIIWK